MRGVDSVRGQHVQRRGRCDVLCVPGRQHQQFGSIHLRLLGGLLDQRHRRHPRLHRLQRRLLQPERLDLRMCVWRRPRRYSHPWRLTLGMPMLCCVFFGPDTSVPCGLVQRKRCNRVHLVPDQQLQQRQRHDVLLQCWLLRHRLGRVADVLGVLGQHIQRRSRRNGLQQLPGREHQQHRRDHVHVLCGLQHLGLGQHTFLLW